ncbi:MAG: hypothetical protein CMJ83_11845 [Planctomycetes bacterium]|nr:hypothetical protein [Planctomycetota bacterium]
MTALEDTKLAEMLRAETRGLVGWLLLLTGNRDLADELFQDVCLEVWRTRSRFEEGGDFGAWVRGVARHVVLRERRRRGRSRVTPWSPEIIDRLEAGQADLAAAEDDRRDAPRRAALATCLGDLDPSQRTVLARIYDDRVSHAVVAREIGRSADAVKMLAMRLRTKLKDCVARRLKEEELDVL